MDNSSGNVLGVTAKVISTLPLPGTPTMQQSSQDIRRNSSSTIPYPRDGSHRRLSSSLSAGIVTCDPTLKDWTDRYMYKHCPEWKAMYPETKGKRQSPINLFSQDAVYDPSLTKSQMTFAYSTSRDTEILNNGHTLVIYPRSKQVLSGGPLSHGSEYELGEIRFHWGRDDSRGSEHTVNNKAFPMEVQLIHWNTRHQDNQEDALGRPGGVVIVSLFTQVGREHQGLRVITDGLEDVQYKGRQKSLLTGFNPACLLPDPSLRDFWTYDGSLTAPPCNEEVTWILFRYPLMISHPQIEEFRRLRTTSKGDILRVGDDGIMVDNFRPIQPLHGRKCRASFQS
ncbi:carbonic anhydrase-related protein-like isoform X1 [Haliotis rufescens]|uniref:carbonic anhydrase-related protein-like isoform X1 n=1 Tax=Haliotis rufescens TaxID=6454 RepID=UPI00201FAF5D|nr:carbonic anhydrase-related protein-like isoform X1 [Haliotis rufescens]